MRRTVGAWLAAGTLVLAAGGSWAAEDGRVALVVGNTDYRNVEPVRTAGVDARALAGALEDLGFDVTVGVDMTQAALTEALTRFDREAASAEAAVVAFFGRGRQADGESYLLPVDAPAGVPEEPGDAVPLSAAMSAVAGAETIGVVLVDAARPSATDAAAPDGLARPRTVPSGVAVALSAEPGSLVEDSYRLHSAFGEALLAHVAAEDVQVADMLLRVRQAVINDTEGGQRPAVFGTVDTMDFSFNPAAEPVPEPEQVAGLPAGEPADAAQPEAAQPEAAQPEAAQPEAAGDRMGAAEPGPAEDDMPAVEELAPEAAAVETPSLEEMTGVEPPAGGMPDQAGVDAELEAAEDAAAAAEPEMGEPLPGATDMSAVEELAPEAAEVETPSLDEMTGEALPEAAPEPDRDAAGPAGAMPPDGADAAAEPAGEPEVAAVPEPAAVPPSATADPPPNAEARRAVQRSLRTLGLYDYRIDAIFGPITRDGMRAFQERIGAEPTGYLSTEQVELLHEMAAEAGG